MIRSHLPDAPNELSRDAPHWLDPGLVLSQTCSLPFRTALHDYVALVAAPVTNLDCPAGYYFSTLIVRADDRRKSLKDFDNAHLAINEPASQSGWAAMDASTSSKYSSAKSIPWYPA